MPKDLPNPKELGNLYALAQVGLEMVVPIGIGLAVDHYFDWTPWGVVAGAVVGLVAGITHIVALTNRTNGKESEEPQRDVR